MSAITSSDPVADMLSRIRNAAAVRQHEVAVPHSKLKEAVARLLQANSFLQDVRVSGEGTTKALDITITDAGGTAPITEITRLSKPGRRHYVRSQEIPVVKQGRGIVIISTSKGLMTGDDARAQSIGGELICKVY